MRHAPATDVMLQIIFTEHRLNPSLCLPEKVLFLGKGSLFVEKVQGFSSQIQEAKKCLFVLLTFKELCRAHCEV